MSLGRVPVTWRVKATLSKTSLSSEQAGSPGNDPQVCEGRLLGACDQRGIVLADVTTPRVGIRSMYINRRIVLFPEPVCPTRNANSSRPPLRTTHHPGPYADRTRGDIRETNHHPGLLPERMRPVQSRAGEFDRRDHAGGVGDAPAGDVECRPVIGERSNHREPA